MVYIVLYINFYFCSAMHLKEEHCTVQQNWYVLALEYTVLSSVK
jgi:hypothetical protein